MLYHYFTLMECTLRSIHWRIKIRCNITFVYCVCVTCNSYQIYFKWLFSIRKVEPIEMSEKCYRSIIIVMRYTYIFLESVCSFNIDLGFFVGQIFIKFLIFSKLNSEFGENCDCFEFVGL